MGKEPKTSGNVIIEDEAQEMKLSNMNCVGYHQEKYDDGRSWQFGEINGRHSCMSGVDSIEKDLEQIGSQSQC